MENETEVKMTEEEKQSAIFMLNGNIIKDLNNALYKMMKDEFGYILKGRKSKEVITTDTFKDEYTLQDFYIFLTGIQDYYCHYINGNINVSNQEYLYTWHCIFTSPAAEDQTMTSIVDIIVSKARCTIKRKIHVYLVSIVAKKREIWKSNHSLLIAKLRDKKCINIDKEDNDVFFDGTHWIKMLLELPEK